MEIENPKQTFTQYLCVFQEKSHDSKMQKYNWIFFYDIRNK